MNFSLPAYWRGLANGSRNGLGDRFLLLLLIPLSLPYAFVQLLRSSLYQAGLLRAKQLPRPVISIGNITVGGTGKTPATAYVANSLLGQGLKVAVLSRGYGGTLEGKTAIVSDGRTTLLTAQECGDEPFLLASTIPGLMVVIGSDRHAAGILAMEQFSPDVFLLDDGFQHLRLHRDLNILLLDHDRPFGNGWTIPAGLLREPSSAWQRADLVIMTRSPLNAAVQPVTGKPYCNARHQLADALPLSGGPPCAFAALKGRRLLAFAGIAEPDAFFNDLRAAGVNLVATVAFPDHAGYDRRQLEQLYAAMRSSGADGLITTEKDGVKLAGLPSDIASKTLLARLGFRPDNPVLIQELIHNMLQKK